MQPSISRARWAPRQPWCVKALPDSGLGAFQPPPPVMYIYEAELPTKNSGKLSLYSTSDATSTAISAMRARRKKRLHRGLPLVRSVGAHGRVFLAGSNLKAGFNKVHSQSCRALQPASYRLEIHRHQRKSAILLKRISFTSAYLGFSPTTAAYQHLRGTHATLSDVKARITSKPVRGPRVIDLELVSTVLILGSNREGTFQNLHFGLEPSSISGSGFSIDAEEKSWPREDTKGVGSANSKFSLGDKHGSKSVCDEGTSAKAKLVECLMETFRKYFDKEPKSLAAQPITSDSVISERDRSKYSSTTTVSTGRKRSRTIQERHDTDDDGDDEEKRSKRPKAFSLGSKDTERKFACPYRKRNPQKYSVQQWRSCALTPLETVARLKAHLYRYHRIFQCQRCKVLFPSQEDVRTHLMAAQACEISIAEPVDGITSDIVERLRSRKKIYPGQTEEDRWREVYGILFPHELIPSPYFEPVQENGESKSGSMAEELGAYEEYIRHELPRAVRTALEEELSVEIQPIEESLRHQLINLIADVQDRVFASYRATINPVDEPVTTRSRSQPRYHDSEANEHNLPIISISTPPEDFLQPPPPLAGNVHALDIVNPTFDCHAEDSDSAHISENATGDGVEEQIQASMRSVKDSDATAYSSLSPLGDKGYTGGPG